MLEITRDVWGGHDYLPRVWSSWLDDHAGVLLVADCGGRTVGFQHLAIHPDRSAWLEGIRVHDDVRGLGIATALLTAGIEWARSNELPTVRLSTSSDNPASNRMAERARFDRVARFASVSITEGSESAITGARLARCDEFSAVRAFLASSPDSQYYTEGWTAYRITDVRLRLLIATQQVIVAGSGDLQGVAIATASVGRAVPRPGLLRGSADAATRILDYLRAAQCRLGVASVRGQVTVADDMWEQLGFHGLQRAWEHDMVLWELHLGMTAD